MSYQCASYMAVIVKEGRTSPKEEKNRHHDYTIPTPPGTISLTILTSIIRPTVSVWSSHRPSSFPQTTSTVFPSFLQPINEEKGVITHGNKSSKKHKQPQAYVAIVIVKVAITCLAFLNSRVCCGKAISAPVFVPWWCLFVLRCCDGEILWHHPKSCWHVCLFIFFILPCACLWLRLWMRF